MKPFSKTNTELLTKLKLIQRRVYTRMQPTYDFESWPNGALYWAYLTQPRVVNLPNPAAIGEPT